MTNPTNPERIDPSIEEPKVIAIVNHMILGTMIMLLGGFIMVDQSSNLGGTEFFILLIGLIIGIVGLFQKD